MLDNEDWMIIEYLEEKLSELISGRVTITVVDIYMMKKVIL